MKINWKTLRKHSKLIAREKKEPAYSVLRDINKNTSMENMNTGCS